MSILRKNKKKFFRSLFVDVVWLFCAPLWIYIGCVVPFIIVNNLIALGTMFEGKDTEVAVEPCNSYDLTTIERNEGPQHVVKAVNVFKNIGLTARKICHGSSTIFGRALQNPICITYAISIMINESVSIITAGIGQNNRYEPKTENAKVESTMGSPKGSNSYGDGVSILDYRKGGHSVIKGKQRMYSTSAVAGKTNAFTGAELLSEMKVRGGKYTGLYDLIITEKLLFAAYHSIKSKPGNMTPGVDESTLDELSPEVLGKISESLKTEKFQFKPTRREYIKKANGKLRPLGIPSPNDKVIQKAMAILLEIIYEQEFMTSSHGFRPNRGCHTAIATVNQWKGTMWAIEGDIKGFFDNIDHRILVNLLEKKIKDQRFIDLVWKLIRAGYVEKGVKRDSLVGTPRSPLVGIGGILSPILSNIYLHEFDKYMEEIISEFGSKAKDITKRNPEYDKITRRIQYLRDKYPQVTDRPESIRKEIEGLIKERNSIPARLPNGTRVRYVRYADDWIIGIYGSKEFSEMIKEKASRFLREELKVELSEEKTKITNLLKAAFLGFYIRIRKPKENKRVVTIFKGTKRKVKVGHNVMEILAPYSKIISKLIKEGFIEERKDSKIKYVPQAKTAWIHLDHHGILSRYNWISRGLCNYYRNVNNIAQFHFFINFILRNSCAKTLARKLNLSSRKKAFQKFGYDLETKTGPKIKFYTEKDFKQKLEWTNVLDNIRPFDVLNWRLRTQTNFWDKCRICGSLDGIEMHH